MAHLDPGLSGEQLCQGWAEVVGGGDVSYTSLQAADKDGLSEGLEGGGLFRKSTLLNSAQQSTSFTPLP